MSNVIDFKELTGKTVICTGGYILGEVTGVNIDTKTWQVVKLHVKLSDTAAEQLGYKKRFRSSTICIPVTIVQAVADVVNVVLSLKQLGESNEITDCKESNI